MAWFAEAEDDDDEDVIDPVGPKNREDDGWDEDEKKPGGWAEDFLGRGSSTLS